MAALLHRALRRVGETLRHLPHEVVVFIFIFWCIQVVGWACMMVYVEFFNQALGRSVLYVTQISHWALVEAAGTAALSSWVLIQAKHNQSKLEQIKREEDQIKREQKP